MYTYCQSLFHVSSKFFQRQKKMFKYLSEHLAQGVQDRTGKRRLMFSVKNSWTLLAIVPSSALRGLSFLCPFSTIISPIRVQSNATFYTDSHVRAGADKACSCLTVCTFCSSLSSTPIPKHEVQKSIHLQQSSSWCVKAHAWQPIRLP